MVPLHQGPDGLQVPARPGAAQEPRLRLRRRLQARRAARARPGVCPGLVRSFEAFCLLMALEPVN